jgi:hypothetical protein
LKAAGGAVEGDHRRTPSRPPPVKASGAGNSTRPPG